MNYALKIFHRLLEKLPTDGLEILCKGQPDERDP